MLPAEKTDWANYFNLKTDENEDYSSYVYGKFHR